MSKFHSEGGGVLSTVRKDGKTVYYIRYGYKGRRPVEKVGLDLDRARGRIEARREALEDPSYIPPPIKRELEREAAAKAKAKPVPMFSDVLKVYRRECAPLRRDQQWQKDMLRIIGKEFDGLTIAEVDADRIEAWRDRLKEPRVEKDKNGQPVERRLSAQTVRSYVYFLSGIFKSCGEIAKGRALVTGNPEIRVTLDEERAKELGLDVSTVGRFVELVVAGRRLTTAVEGGREVDLNVVAAQEAVSSPSSWRNSASSPRPASKSPSVAWRESGSDHRA